MSDAEIARIASVAASVVKAMSESGKAQAQADLAPVLALTLAPAAAAATQERNPDQSFPRTTRFIQGQEAARTGGNGRLAKGYESDAATA